MIDLPKLSVPHPRMNERAFVLIPLNDIAANVIEPRSKLKVKDLVFVDDSVRDINKVLLITFIFIRNR